HHRYRDHLLPHVPQHCEEALHARIESSSGPARWIAGATSISEHVPNERYYMLLLCTTGRGCYPSSVWCAGFSECGVGVRVPDCTRHSGDTVSDTVLCACSEAGNDADGSLEVDTYKTVFSERTNRLRFELKLNNSNPQICTFFQSSAIVSRGLFTIHGAAYY
ncbi:hypothetical protein CcCBS67573_g01957, partial [Chytriomyces confervae]